MSLEVVKHGASGYRKGCKCSVCRAGHNAAQRAYNAKRKAAGKAAPRRRTVDAAEALAAVGIEVPDDAEPIPADIAPSPPPPQFDPTSPPGPIEATLTELDEDGDVKWNTVLLALARYHAKVLDQLPAMDRLDLVSPISGKLLDAVKLVRPDAPPRRPTSEDDEHAEKGYIDDLGTPTG